jgi:hypothetical protein
MLAGAKWMEIAGNSLRMVPLRFPKEKGLSWFPG